MPSFLSMLVMPMATIMQMGMALWLFDRPLRSREGYAWRLLLVVMLATIAILAGTWIGFVAHPELMGSYEALTSALTFEAVLVFMPFIVLWCRETTPWTAVWCASAAYTMQNLASGFGELLLLLASRMGYEVRGLGLAGLLLGWAVVYGACWALLVKRLWEGGVFEVEDRRMLVALLLVLLLVIGLDALAKDLMVEGTSFADLLSLRIMHCCVCMFFLYVGYELLFSLRLRNEVATLRALTDERERQYALSRETFAAVNARVHDMRHQVLRSLEAGTETPLDRSLLAEVAREMDVYDLVVRTGCEALDTAVTERALLCRREGIELMCVADGSALSTLPPADIYTIVGGMLDLAIASAASAHTEGVDLTVRKRAELAVVHVEWEGCAPDATGVSTLRSLVERHGGTFAVGVRDDVASMNALLPAG